MSKIVCYGEVLWDIFPDGNQKIGGAPLNVALRLKASHHDINMVSAVGKDALGTKLLDYLDTQHIPNSHIQVKPAYPTGTVRVELDAKKSATYSITAPSAWDAIDLKPETVAAVKASHAFVFGSLAARHEQSKTTLMALLEVANYKILDLNLRPPHYTLNVLKALMEAADFIKFNDDELFEICEDLGIATKHLETAIKAIATLTSTNTICVTLGGDGAVLLKEGVFYTNSGYKVEVVDTVGAGDAFLGALISELLKETPAQDAVNIACATGALVAAQQGASPIITRTEIAALISRA